MDGKETHPHSSIRQERLTRSATEVVDAVNGRRGRGSRDSIIGRNDLVGLLANRVPEVLRLSRLMEARRHVRNAVLLRRCRPLLLVLVGRLREEGFDGGRRGLHARVEVRHVGVLLGVLSGELLRWLGDVGSTVERLLEDVLVGGRETRSRRRRSVDHVEERVNSGRCGWTTVGREVEEGGVVRERRAGGVGLKLVQERRTRGGGGGRRLLDDNGMRCWPVGRRTSSGGSRRERRRLENRRGGVGGGVGERKKGGRWEKRRGGFSGSGARVDGLGGWAFGGWARRGGVESAFGSECGVEEQRMKRRERGNRSVVLLHQAEGSNGALPPPALAFGVPWTS
jgi:hypothetical protein